MNQGFYMNDWQLKTPVAFLIFNRPDTTEKVFEAICQAKPPKLLVVADGPCADRSGEVEKCAAARAIIEKVDWNCKVLKNYSNVNMGCKRRISSGLDWVFNTVNEAIILEDDCLPHPTFFRFCEELLERYRDDERIMMACGFNSQTKSIKGQHSYFFSKYPHIWGWASWRRVWKYYDVEMARWPELRDSKRYRDFSISADESSFWRRYFDLVFQGAIDTWDAQGTFMSFCQSGMSIFPNENLISNIGFGLDATHTAGNSDLAKLKTYPIEFPLKHPEIMIRDVTKDEIRRKKEYSNKGLFLKSINKIFEVSNKFLFTKEPFNERNI